MVKAVARERVQFVLCDRRNPHSEQEKRSGMMAVRGMKKEEMEANKTEVGQSVTQESIPIRTYSVHVHACTCTAGAPSSDFHRLDISDNAIT